MQCFLEDADAKQKEDKKVRNWIAEIREVAYDAEDVVENFILHVEKEGKIRGMVRQMDFSVGSKIQDIQKKISDLTRSLETYGIGKLLVRDEKCRVVSICGMGGLGKTTLATKIIKTSHPKEKSKENQREAKRSKEENRGQQLQSSLAFLEHFRSPFLHAIYHSKLRKSRIQRFNRVRFGAKTRKIWPSEDNCSSQTTSEDVFSEDERLNFWFLGVMEAR
ncbi:putative disease resistance protein [Vitis vinifera]|uniref:Putative disease resistance protein n=1 Tax=Vitis vinifera TaxID=29760 RepID=A0A438GAP1_VITVI|nr:putative disease resistance protein [Vitis vinifera]